MIRKLLDRLDRHITSGPVGIQVVVLIFGAAIIGGIFRWSGFSKKDTAVQLAAKQEQAFNEESEVVQKDFAAKRRHYVFFNQAKGCLMVDAALDDVGVRKVLRDIRPIAAVPCCSVRDQLAPSVRELACPNPNPPPPSGQ